MGKVFDALSRKAKEQDLDVPEFLNVEGEGPIEGRGRSVEKNGASSKDRAEDVDFERPNTQGWDDILIEVHERTTGVAESLRVLRAQILYPPAGPPPKSILVTSTLPGEGKTFIAANLGIIMAQGLEQYALIVDCDLRRPALHKFFGISNEVGLTDHLKRGVDLGKLIKKTGMKKLSIIPSGPTPSNPSELLGSERMAECLHEIVTRYDDRFVILDSPPTQVASEIAVLSRYVDTAVLVIRWGKSKRELIRKAVDTIGRDKFLGVIFNAYEMSFVEKKYRSYYGYDGYTYRAY